MGKGFIKFRMSRVIPTFHSCRSKDPSTLPTNPVPSFLHRSPTPTTTPKPHRSSIKRHVSSAFLSARHACLRPRPSPEASHTESPTPPPPPSHFSHFKWGKINSHPHWHVIAKTNPSDQHNYDSTPPRRKIYNSAASETDRENDVVFLPPPPTKTTRAKKTRRRRRTSLQKARLSTSSDSGLFTEDFDDDDNLERETLVSTDSPKSKERENNHQKYKTKKKTTKRRSFEESVNTASSPVPARLSEFMRKMAPCRAEVNGKVRESFAMVKRSDDPCEDFKRSMVEMVVEKQMFEERELEELLRCFLSLNSERHHQAIVTAFTQIWNTVFSNSPSSH